MLRFSLRNGNRIMKRWCWVVASLVYPISFGSSRRDVHSDLRDMNEMWCTRYPKNSICLRLAAKQKAPHRHLPPANAEDIRAMHLMWCDLDDHMNSGLCVMLEMEKMHEYWCANNPESNMCSILEWRRAMKSGNHTKTKRPPLSPGRPEMRVMLSTWCADSVVHNPEVGLCRDREENIRRLTQHFFSLLRD